MPIRRQFGIIEFVIVDVIDDRSGYQIFDVSTLDERSKLTANTEIFLQKQADFCAGNLSSC